MKAALLELICCPNCRQALHLGGHTTAYDEIWSGVLHCSACETSYPIQKGMPYLFLANEAWQPKAREADGWVTLHQDMGIYEQEAEAIDLQIPYYPQEPWIKVARGFDMALSYLNLTGTETVLDLGAGRGWAAKEFARRGCRVVALDVIPDKNVGLGRAKALMDHAKTYFDRVIGDGENLPFRPGVFDLVFCAATLHHTSHLPLMMQNIAGVLAKGGRLCAMNEPCIGILEEEEAVLKRDAAHELSLGINERRPNIVGYFEALQAANLQVVKALPAHIEHLNEANLRLRGQNVGALPGRVSLRQLRRSLWQWYAFGKNRLWAWQKGVYGQTRLPTFNQTEDRLSYAVLLWGGGELLLIAKDSS